MESSQCVSYTIINGCIVGIALTNYERFDNAKLTWSKICAYLAIQVLEGDFLDEKKDVYEIFFAALDVEIYSMATSVKRNMQYDSQIRPLE